MKFFFMISVFLMGEWFHGPLMADSLKGEFTFSTRKPPMVALIMFPEDKSLTKADVVDQKEKGFTQIMYVAPPKSKMVFKNSDSISHNIFSKDTKLGVDFDFGLMASGSEFSQEVNWEDGGVIKLNCKIHPLMLSYVACIQTKYYKVVEIGKNATLSFSMDDLPAEHKKVRIWMPSYKVIEFELGEKKNYSFDLARVTSPDKLEGSLSWIINENATGSYSHTLRSGDGIGKRLS